MKTLSRLARLCAVLFSVLLFSGYVWRQGQVRSVPPPRPAPHEQAQAPEPEKPAGYHFNKLVMSGSKSMGRPAVQSVPAAEDAKDLRRQKEAIQEALRTPTPAADAQASPPTRKVIMSGSKSSLAEVVFPAEEKLLLEQIQKESLQVPEEQRTFWVLEEFIRRVKAAEVAPEPKHAAQPLSVPTEPAQPKPLRKVLMPGSKAGLTYVFVTEEGEQAIQRMYEESKSVEEEKRYLWVMNEFHRLSKKYSGQRERESLENPEPAQTRTVIMLGSKSSGFREIDVKLPKAEEKTLDLPKEVPSPAYPNTR